MNPILLDTLRLMLQMQADNSTSPDNKTIATNVVNRIMTVINKDSLLVLEKMSEIKIQR